MPTELDDASFPLVRVHAYGENTDEDIDLRMRFVEALRRRDRTFAIVFDTSGAEPLSARHRRRWTRWLHDHDSLVASRVAGCAVVLTSAAVRAVFTAILWASPPSMPYTFVATRSEGEAWARAMLASGARLRG